MLGTHPRGFFETFRLIWPVIWSFDTGRYLVAAGAMTLVLWAFRGGGLAARRIQTACPIPRDVKREVLTSLCTALVFSLIGFGIYEAAALHWITLYANFSERGVGYLLLTLVLMVVAHDAYFYWTHRLMHHRRLFRWFHLTHHRSHTPTPWAAYAFSVPEALVQGSFVALLVALAPVHELAIFLFMAFQIVRNVMGHAGVEVHPAGMNRSWLRWNNTTTHHDMHHQTGRHNFGLYFRWWDRLMGTEHPDYLRRFEALTEPEHTARSSAIDSAKAIAALMIAGMCFPSASTPAIALESDPILGEWATQGMSAKVKVAPCAERAALICGTITWLWEPVDDRGRAKTDTENPDARLRGRPLIGLPILSGFRRAAAGELAGGTIYNPEDGRTYDATLRLRGADTLIVEGCFLVFCRKQVWRKVSAIFEAR
jgi:sterol desaturase/sphingolipid hydroxylase (fatty acid hydroxylase superfamily)/uncharacterized protein (DUF2147 family)